MPLADNCDCNTNGKRSKVRPFCELLSLGLCVRIEVSILDALEMARSKPARSASEEAEVPNLAASLALRASVNNHRVGSNFLVAWLGRVSLG